MKGENREMKKETMQKPLLSIIIPHFENADGLEILLKSIFSDAIANPDINFETLVIDDYSCEQIQKELIKLQAKYDFKLYHNNSIKSAGTCRNIGVDNSNGKWLLFADSDDYFLPDFLKSVSKYFDSSYDIIFFSPISRIYGTNIESDRHKLYQKHIRKYLDFKEEMHLRVNWSVPWSKMMNHDFIINNNIKFDSVKAYNDKYFSICAGLKASKICVDKNNIYCVTSRSNSLNTIKTYENITSRIKVNIRVNKLLTHNNLKKFKYSFLVLLIQSAKLGIYPFFKSLKLILLNGENPFYNISWFLHEYLVSKKYKKGGKPLRSIVSSLIDLVKRRKVRGET